MVGSISGLLALVIWGAEPAPTAADASRADAIVCEVQVLTVDGLNWRTDLHRRLRSVARQGTSTIWTADRDVKGRLEELGRDRAIKAPKVCSTPDAVASIRTDKVVEYTRHVDVRDHAAPARGLSPSMTFAAERGMVREGVEATFAAKRLDQGVLARVKVAESHIGAMHKYPVEEGLFGIGIVVKPPTSLTPIGLLTSLAASLSGTATDADRCAQQNAEAAAAVGFVEVPEVFLSQVEGEWLVPDDGVLVISMGVNTVADEQGRAVVQDRLAILDFGARVAPDAGPAATTAMPVEAPTGIIADATEAPAPLAVALSTLNLPPVPDRSLPEGIDRDGRVVDLPPLPEAYASLDLNQISPGSPLASSQAPPIRLAGVKPMADPALARTSYEPSPTAAAEVATGPARLTALVAGFLNRGMTPPGCDEDGCPGATCPLPTADAAATDEADGCPECPALAAPVACPAAPTGGRVEMGVSVRDEKGARVADSECDLVAALRNPGTTETKYIELGRGMALEIQARVVARPDTAKVRDGKPARVGKPVSVQARAGLGD